MPTPFSATPPVLPSPPQRYDPAEQAQFRREIERAISDVKESNEYSALYGEIYDAGGAVLNIMHPKFGVVGDGVTNDTSAIQAAADFAAAEDMSIYIPSRSFAITSTPGNYGLTINCPIMGNGPNLSKIVNTGTGSALKLEGVTAGARYYTRFSGFRVVGNSSSQDGIVLNPDLDINTPVAYSMFSHVDSYSHGRHGLVHNYSWATRYADCKFSFNDGLGVYLITGALSEHNNIIFRECDARWNGGVGDAGADFLKGGVRFSGNCAGVYWLGGAVESNNAWGFIVGEDATVVSGASKVILNDVYCEGHPKNTATSTVGGHIRVSAKYSDVSVFGCTLPYGDALAAGQTGYAFFIDDAPDHSPGFREWNNKVYAVSGSGTGIRDSGITHAANWGSDAEIINKLVNRDFSGGNDWANVDMDQFDATGDLTMVATASQSAYLPKAQINGGMGFVYGKRYGIKYDALASDTMYFASFTKVTKLSKFVNGTGQTQEFTWLETNANQNLYIYSDGAATLASLDNINIYEIEGGSSPQGHLHGLLSETIISLATAADHVIYIVPAGKRAVLTHAVLVVGGDADGACTISIGLAGSETDFIPAYNLGNTAAQNDAVILRPIDSTTPLKLKSYQAGSVIEARVTATGNASNELFLYGLVY